MIPFAIFAVLAVLTAAFVAGVVYGDKIKAVIRAVRANLKGV